MSPTVSAQLLPSSPFERSCCDVMFTQETAEFPPSRRRWLLVFVGISCAGIVPTSFLLVYSYTYHISHEYGLSARSGCSLNMGFAFTKGNANGIGMYAPVAAEEIYSSAHRMRRAMHCDLLGVLPYMPTQLLHSPSRSHLIQQARLNRTYPHLHSHFHHRFDIQCKHSYCTVIPSENGHAP